MTRVAGCSWCGGSGYYHVGAGNLWECPLCRKGPLHGVERERLEGFTRPLDPRERAALDRDKELRAKR